MTYCLPFYPHRQWNGILCSPARRLGLGSLQSSAQRERRSWLLPPRSYGRVSQSKQECPGAPWPRWDGSSSRETLSYRRSGSVPSLGDGAGLTMAWDESLGMERQSSDKMVARDSGMAAIALKPLPPTRHVAHWSGHCSVFCPWRASVSGRAGCQSRATSPHAMPLWGWH